MDVIQRPAAVSFLGSVKDVILGEVSDSVNITVSYKSEDTYTPYFYEEYTSDPDDSVTIEIKDILRAAFNFSMDQIPYDVVQNTNMKDFRFVAKSPNQVDVIINFRIIAGQVERVDDIGFIYSEYLNGFGQIKESNIDCPEILNLYTETDGVHLKCDCHLQYSSGVTTLDLGTLTAGLLLIPIDFRAILNMLPDGSRLQAIDVYPDIIGFAPQRFVIRDRRPEDDFFYFENSLGGMELILFTGEKNRIGEYASVTASYNEEVNDYDNDVSATFKKNTGYLRGELENECARDFMRSDNRYHVLEYRSIRRIIILKSSISEVIQTVTNAEFEFRYQTEDVYRRPRTASAVLPESLCVSAIADQNNSIYRLYLLIAQLRREMEQYQDDINDRMDELQKEIDELEAKIVAINDTVPSLTTTYSGSKIESIKQDLGNLFPYKTAAYNNVRIDDIITFLKTNIQGRQIIPMLACGGTLNKSGVPTIKYGPISWSAGSGGEQLRITHNLGHTNYIFTASAWNTSSPFLVEPISVMIRQKTVNYIDIVMATGRPDSDRDYSANDFLDFVIYTFTDPRLY